jgi:hypothetical protein
MAGLLTAILPHGANQAPAAYYAATAARFAAARRDSRSVIATMRVCIVAG